MKKLEKKKKTFIISSIILFIIFCWFCLVIFEYTRVKTDKRPIVCFNEIKDVEDDDEYSKMCYGLLYKYKEYYYKDTNKMSARELTLFFLDFKRQNDGDI